eukprot:TRINITY_DN6929_c0_g1_i1.p1 TRINITY_DN6929_c0_g1~~TRINITY_DN6929_c0_g1_i1.p1  ORF type:complete len:128 (-),score=17.46 TRINITY_DN6929_c0_g1_i1:37-363(-)
MRAERCALVMIWESPFELLQWLDIAGMHGYACICKGTSVQVAAQKAKWESKLKGFNLASLEEQLKLMRQCHGQTIRSRGHKLNTNRSAADVYRCWPSTAWYRREWPDL